jgi:hypothetical protein
LVVPVPIWEPLLSIIFCEAIWILPKPLANVIVATGPLPENGVVLMTAILIDPGTAVFAASIAPDTRLPLATVGVVREPL